MGFKRSVWMYFPIAWLLWGGIAIGNAQPNKKLGDLARIDVGRNMSISVIVDITKRPSRAAVAQNFLADPSRAGRLTRRGKMTVPFAQLSDPYKAITAMRLWPNTRVVQDKLRHQVSLENESERGIAAIFTGSGRNANLVEKLGTVSEIRVERDGQIWLRIDIRHVNTTHLAYHLLINPAKANRLTNRNIISIPFPDLKHPYKALILGHLFTDDELREDALRHRVQLRVETLGRLSRWYTGSEGNWRRIKRASNKRSDNIAMREMIKIPTRLLAEWATLTESQIIDGTSDYPLVLQSASRPAELSSGRLVAIPKDRLSSWTSLIDSSEDRAMEAAGWFVYDGQENGPLKFGFDSEGGYAGYRLRAGEALYTAVAIRFAGVDRGADVIRVAGVIQRRSGISDVRNIPVGAHIKIPMNHLTPEWRPEGDPTRTVEEKEEQEVRETIREIAREVRAVRSAKPLKGVVVILDAGHGGRDPGKQNRRLNMSENEYAYDIMCRIKRLLEQRTDARVFATIEDQSNGFAVSNRSILRDNTDEHLLTTPNYRNRKPKVSAHLRWALANSIFRRVVREGINSDNVVFTSIHINSLHASHEGAMAFIPSSRHTKGNRNFNMDPYRQFREIRQRPQISYTYKQRRRSQAASQRFSDMFMEQCRRNNVLVMGRKPVRPYIIRARGRRPYVPAVLRYNAVPNKQLLELANLNSRRDSVRLQDHRYRQKYAKAYVDALIRYYGG